LRRRFSPEESIERRRARSIQWNKNNPEIAKNRSRAWALAHPERMLEHFRKFNKKKYSSLTAEAKSLKVLRERIRRKNIQLEAIAYYGGKCYCCGETIATFLALDHINGGGNKHHKELKSNTRIAQWAKRNK